MLPALGPAARRVLAARYLLRDGVEDEESLFHRVARGVAEAERAWGGEVAVAHWAKVFHARMRGLEFLPNSPALMNAGTDVGQLSACFVLPVPSDRDAFLRVLGDVAKVQRTGGGVGFSFSNASDAVACIRLVDAATDVFRANAPRRGANMAVLAVDHPDVQHFVAAKTDEGLRNFNLSVGVTDAFMQAVQDDGPHALVDPATGEVVQRLPARALFDHIVDSAWRTGDPGIVFLDAVQRADPMQAWSPIAATNPCGEVPLRPHEACTLGSLNLARFVDGAMDLDRLAAAVHDAIRFLDDVVEVTRHPSPDIAAASLATRKVGLGVMGFAEALLRLGVPYGSEASIRLAEEWMKRIQEEADAASLRLGEERGAFPAWKESRFAKEGRPYRNATRTSIAPTGTIAILAGTTPGIEPLFALAFRREHVLEGQSIEELNPLVEQHIRRIGMDPGPVIDHVHRTGRLPDTVPQAVRDVFVTALEVRPDRHVQVQAAFQRHVDNAVSKTVNLPEDAPRGAVREVFIEAWRRGLKGVTVYRYGSKRQQVMHVGTRPCQGVVAP